VTIVDSLAIPLRVFCPEIEISFLELELEKYWPVSLYYPRVHVEGNHERTKSTGTDFFQAKSETYLTNEDHEHSFIASLEQISLLIFYSRVLQTFRLYGHI
jgi:hypothetical protein